MPLWLHIKPKEVGKDSEIEKIKIIVPFRSYPTCYTKFQKNRKKNLENKKIPLWHHFKSKEVGKGRERKKIKIIIPFRSYPTHNRKLQKK